MGKCIKYVPSFRATFSSSSGWRGSVQAAPATCSDLVGVEEEYSVHTTHNTAKENEIRGKSIISVSYEHEFFNDGNLFSFSRQSSCSPFDGWCVELGERELMVWNLKMSDNETMMTTTRTPERSWWETGGKIENNGTWWRERDERTTRNEQKKKFQWKSFHNEICRTRNFHFNFSFFFSPLLFFTRRAPERAEKMTVSSQVMSFVRSCNACLTSSPSPPTRAYPHRKTFSRNSPTTTSNPS